MITLLFPLEAGLVRQSLLELGIYPELGPYQMKLSIGVFKRELLRASRLSSKL